MKIALMFTWGAFAAAVLVVALISALAGAQSPAICNGGMCVMPESDLRNIIFYLQYLEKINVGKCA